MTTFIWPIFRCVGSEVSFPLCLDEIPSLQTFIQICIYIHVYYVCVCVYIYSMCVYMSCFLTFNKTLDDITVNTPSVTVSRMAQDRRPDYLSKVPASQILFTIIFTQFTIPSLNMVNNSSARLILRHFNRQKRLFTISSYYAT